MECMMWDGSKQGFVPLLRQALLEPNCRRSSRLSGVSDLWQKSDHAPVSMTSIESVKPDCAVPSLRYRPGSNSSNRALRERSPAFTRPQNSTATPSSSQDGRYCEDYYGGLGYGQLGRIKPAPVR